MNIYHTSSTDSYSAFEEICSGYSVDCYEVEEGNRLKGLKKKDSECTTDTAQYILYTNVPLTLVAVTQLQSHVFKSKSKAKHCALPGTPRLQEIVGFRKVRYKSTFAQVGI
jgi:hypothetical protein